MRRARGADSPHHPAKSFILAPLASSHYRTLKLTQSLVHDRPGGALVLIDSTPGHPPQRRPIRSYVLRQGRLTEAQERAFAQLWPRFGVEREPGQVLDLPALFGNDRSVFLEIGFGNGQTLAEIAAHHPECNYLGVEVHGPGVGHLLLEIDRRGLTNLRLLRQDAVDLLDKGLAPASLAGVYLLFPDPWPKKRHHKRRLIQPGFVALAASRLSTGPAWNAAKVAWPAAMRPAGRYVIVRASVADAPVRTSAAVARAKLATRQSSAAVSGRGHCRRSRSISDTDARRAGDCATRSAPRSDATGVPPAESCSAVIVQSGISNARRSVPSGPVSKGLPIPR